MTSIARKIITSLAVAGAAAVISVGGAATASAQQLRLLPALAGHRPVHAGQYAAFQVRADASATADGAKFKLLRNGVVVANTAEPGERLGGRAAQRLRHLPRPRLLLGVRPEHRHPQHRRHPADCAPTTEF